MKKFFFYFISIIFYYLLLTAVIFSFSYISLINGKTYDLLWIKYIQKKLYISGSRNIWQKDKNCSKFDVNLLYSPIIGECSFFNPEFQRRDSLRRDSVRKPSSLKHINYESEKTDKIRKAY